ncbi:MAG: hypothetical protein M1834_007936 [Cirrosporium novae-zelandiae]|nr:MAG: hypothetical protein M1834_007936 [Cirrosporium novae-zelandiae]
MDIVHLLNPTSPPPTKTNRSCGSSSHLPSNIISHPISATRESPISQPHESRRLPQSDSLAYRFASRHSENYQSSTQPPRFREVPESHSTSTTLLKHEPSYESSFGPSQGFLPPFEKPADITRANFSVPTLNSPQPSSSGGYQHQLQDRYPILATSHNNTCSVDSHYPLSTVMPPMLTSTSAKGSNFHHISSSKSYPDRTLINNIPQRYTPSMDSETTTIGESGSPNTPHSRMGEEAEKTSDEVPEAIEQPSQNTSGIPTSCPSRTSCHTCLFMPNCDLTDTDFRKVVSHIFGRNKKQTKTIPEQAFIYYCRPHYQRTRYRNKETWGLVQHDLILQQLKRFRVIDSIIDFDVIFRAREKQKQIEEDSKLADQTREQDRKRKHGRDDDKINVIITKNPKVLTKAPEVLVKSSEEHIKKAKRSTRKAKGTPKTLEEIQKERMPTSSYLKGYMGKRKSYDDLKEIMNVIWGHMQTFPDSRMEFPDIEFLPNVKDEQNQSSLTSGQAQQLGQLDIEVYKVQNKEEEAEMFGGVSLSSNPQSGEVVDVPGLKEEKEEAPPRKRRRMNMKKTG